MSIIAFIQILSLFLGTTARPATDDVLSTFANHRWTVNVAPRANPAYEMISTASSMNVAHSVGSKSQYTTTIFQNQSLKDFAENPTGSDITLFNASFPEKELRAITIKYSSASRYLKGTGLAPLPDFTYLSSLLANSDEHTQVSGSEFVWDLETDGDDVAYYGQFNLGTSPQAVLLDVDTGSADLWVAADCTKCDPLRTQFSPSDSSTYINTGQPFSLAYGTGRVEGRLAQETVTLGPMTVHQQYFGAISNISNDFADVPFNGIIGMAFSSISTSRKPTFMERLIKERQVNIAVFSVHLTRHKPRQSEVCIGCYDTSKYIGDISWNPVVSQTYWSLLLDNIQVGGVNTSLRTVTAAIDTGTSLIYIPQDLADSLYSQIPGASRAPEYGPGLYTYPCAYLPDVSLVFGTQSHAINLQDFNLGKTTMTGKDCIGGILATGSDFSPNLAIIGDEFLKSWYSVYDYGQGSRVGFATSVNNQ